MAKNKNHQKQPETGKPESAKTNTTGKSSSKGRGNNGARPDYDKSRRPDSNTRGTRPSDKETKTASSSYDASKSNDIAWWNNSPLFAESTRVPFNRIHGDPLADLGVHFTDRMSSTDPDDWITIRGNTDYNYSMPGIMTIDFIPTIGTTKGEGDSPVNRAFLNLFSVLFSKTAGIPNIEMSELGLYMTSMACIPMEIALVKRALGVTHLYAGQNYYYPRNLLLALGIEPDSIIGKQDVVRRRLNDSILSFNNLKIPDFMSIYKRWYTLAHNIYADEDSITAQLYAFKPSKVWGYIDHGVSGKSDFPHLAAYTVPGSGETTVDITELLDQIDMLIGLWRNSSDLGPISGNIQRYFGDATLVQLEMVQPDVANIPVCDRNILWQINNISTMQLDPGSLVVTQNVLKNQLEFKPTFTYQELQNNAFALDSWMHWRSGTVLNSFDGTTDPEFVMEATRLMSIPGDRVTEGVDSPIGYINTEVVQNFRVYWRAWDRDVGEHILQHVTLATYIHTYGLGYDQGDPAESPDPDQAQTWVGQVGMSLGMLSKFKHGPRVHLLTNVNTGTELAPNLKEFNITQSFGDVFRYTVVDRDMLVQLNKTALQSVYATSFAVV